MKALVLKRLLPAAIEDVFAAWSTAEALSRWFVCDPAWTGVATIDFRVGGAYRLEMHAGGTLVGSAWGEYLEITPPHRLAFSWSSQGEIDVRNTRVVVELATIGRNTELTLTHDLDVDSDEGRAHAAGWNLCFDELEKEVS